MHVWLLYHGHYRIDRHGKVEAHVSLGRLLSYLCGEMTACRKAHHSHLVGVDVQFFGMAANIAQSRKGIVERIRILTAARQQTIVSDERRNALHAIFEHKGCNTFRLEPSSHTYAFSLPVEP